MKKAKLIAAEDIRLLAQRFGAMCGMILERKVQVVPISGQDLGYTINEDGNIFVNFNHQIVADLMLSMKKRITFALGVVTHELLHLLLTSFSAMRDMEKQQESRSQQKLAHQFFNILEDARIEYFAPSVLGKNMCSALAWNKQCVFNWQKDIDTIEESDGLAQYMMALIQYGDGAAIKGHFTHEQARQIFDETMPYLDESMKCHTTAECAEYVQKVFDASKPLWEHLAQEENEFNDLLDALAKLLQSDGGVDVDQTSSGEPLVDGKHLKLPISSKGGADEPPSGVKDSGKPNSEKGEASEGDNPSEDAADKLGGEELESAIANSEDVSGNGKGTLPTNIMEPENYDDACYQKIRMKMAADTRYLTRQLTKIFSNDREKEVYSHSGRYQPQREFGGRQTSRVCTRRLAPDDKNDMSIMVLVDMSGSTDRERRYEIERDCTVMLAETAAQLHTPISVIGFSADEEGSNTIQHIKFLMWDNSLEKRIKLTGIKPRANNADGYSIRYASKLLSKRPEKHKLLFVISDGCPAAFVYRDWQGGIDDTKKAIVTAKKMGEVVCGILVGNEDAGVHREMYGKNFVHIDDGSSVRKLAQKLESLVKEMQ